ncbi:MAG: DUF2723 domain-containing protein [Myxococcales bacterium]|nr:DUF2723 domain-containing protein [Myxococcales bacterium]
MSLLKSRRAKDPNIRVIAWALAAGVPFAAFLATASANDFWLDGGEFTAQGIGLDIAHPPGHPLAALVAKLFSLLPIGPLSLRVAVGQAACAAGAAGFLFSAIHTTVRALGVSRDRVAIPLALGGTWWVACSYAWWFQAVRPEVYALEALLIMIAIERIVALEAAWPTHDVRPLYTATLALGLGLANHHFMAFLVFPALAPTLARVYRARGTRPLWLSGLALAVGLASYVYLPIRGSQQPMMNLGDPTDPSRFYWVVSARVYAQHIGTEAPQPIGERYADLLALVGENLGGPFGHDGDELTLAARSFGVLALLLLGLYALLRTPGARRLGTTWALVLAFSLLARAWLGPVRSNPDVLGYLMPGLAGVTAILTALIALVLGRLGHHKDGKPRMIAAGIAVAVGLLGLAQMYSTASAASLADFRATDAFDEERIRRLPPNAVVVAHAPQTVFRHWAVAASEAARPDVTLVPMPFLNYPGVVDALVARDPDVTELLRGYLLEGELRQPDLQSLAMRRPLLIEMDIRIPPELYETIVPAGLYYEVLDAGATDTDVEEAAGPHAEVIDRLYAHLGDEATRLRETEDQLLWIHYVDALYYAGVGNVEEARRAVRRGLAVQPQAEQLQALGQALESADGPIDVGPFIVQPPG